MDRVWIWLEPNFVFGHGGFADPNQEVIMTLWDTRGTEFGWMVAQVAPWINANAKKGDTVVIDYGLGHLFDNGFTLIGRSKLKGHRPDMLGPNIKGKMKVTTRDNVPLLDGKMKPHNFDDASPRDLVLVHCRSIDRCPERNWSHGKWDELCSRIYTLPHPIGDAQLDYSPGGAYELMDRSLGNTIELLKKASVVIGASSGPMHLAQMCGAPIVVWSGNAGKDRLRYGNVWNHFGTPSTFVAPTWDPTVDQVYDAITEML